jgi:hypothetical protein
MYSAIRAGRQGRHCLISASRVGKRTGRHLAARSCATRTRHRIKIQGIGYFFDFVLPVREIIEIFGKLFPCRHLKISAPPTFK